MAEPVLEIVRSLEGLVKLRDEWNALFARAGRGSQVFQTHAWLAQWAKVYLDASSGLRDGLAVLAVRRDGRLLMVLPMAIEGGIGGRVLRFAGAPVSQYGDAVVDAASEDDRLALLSAGWAHLIAATKPDIVVFDRVREDAAIAPLVRWLGGIGFAHTQAPWVPLAGATGEGFEARQRGTAKRNRRRLMRRLEKDGAVTFGVDVGSETAIAHGCAALAMKRDWVARLGLPSRAFADRRIETFFGGLLGDAEDGGGARVYSLARGGRVVAFAIGIGCKDRMVLHVIVHDATFDDCGAGMLNLEACLRSAESEGFGTFDLLPPTARYKMEFAEGATCVADHAVPLTLRGRVVATVWYGLLRDRVKAAVGRLPLWLRRLMLAVSAQNVTSRRACAVGTTRTSCTGIAASCSGRPPCGRPAP
jgi:CelD/BcsL family acetyltransferase involved in cellulose biosynthesis